LAGIEFGENSKKLGLRVGLTSYKELLGTHYSHVTKELQSEAKATFVRANSSAGDIHCQNVLVKTNHWMFDIV
jgi:hypothetical protein